MSTYQTERAGLFRPAIAALQPYNAGLPVEYVKKRYGLSEVTKLASNESPLGASPKVAEALRAGLSTVAAYPDANCAALRETLSASLSVAPDRIVFGNGSEELISIACRSFLDAEDELIISSPTFSVYADSATIMGAKVVDVPRRADFSLDIEAIEAVISPRTKLLCLCNPNNPTGTPIDRPDFERLARAMGRNGLIIVDEAYYEYAKGRSAYPDSLSFLPGVEAAWLVFRTFSKAYGLAGLRVGYAIASHAEVARQIDMVRTAFNVNHLAQIAALAAWSDQEHVAMTVSLAVQERERMASGLRLRGFAPLSSAANFLFFDAGRPSRELAECLLAQGIIIKPWGGDFSRYIRVSIGTRQQNDSFLAALDKVAAE